VTKKIRPYDPHIVPLQPIDPLPIDPPLVTLCFNAEWIPIIMGSLRALETDFMWAGSQATQDGMTEKAAWLMLAERNCGDMIWLRQNTENPCILEFSHDQEEWLTAFDYSLCLSSVDAPPSATPADIAEILRRLQELLDRYDGTPESVVDNVIDNTTFFNAALCAAIELVIRATAAMLIETKRQKEKDLIGVVLDAFTPILMVAVLLFPITWALAAALVAAYIGFVKAWALSTVDSITIEELQDENAIANVLCVVYLALMNGLLPTIGGFAAAFDSSFYPENSAEWFILEAMHRMAVAGVEMYVSFLDFLDDTYELAMSGLLLDNCIPCTEQCDPFPPLYITWASIGATPEGWTGTADIASYHPEVPHAIPTRGANQNWASGSPDLWRVFTVQYVFSENVQVSKLGLKVTYASTNTHGLVVGVRIGGEWFNMGSYGDSAPAPLTETRTFTFEETCVEAVRFTVYGRFPRLTAVTINDDV